MKLNIQDSKDLHLRKISLNKAVNWSLALDLYLLTAYRSHVGLDLSENKIANKKKIKYFYRM